MKRRAGKVKQGWSIRKPLADAVSSFLTENGLEVKVRGPWEFAFGGVEVIRLHENGQVLMGAADPRRDGYAVGY